MSDISFLHSLDGIYTRSWYEKNRYRCFFTAFTRLRTLPVNRGLGIVNPWLQNNIGRHILLKWFFRNKSYWWIFLKLSLNVLYQALFRKKNYRSPCSLKRCDYPIYACTRAYHARFSSIHITFCGSWNLTGRQCQACGTI